MLLDLLGPGRRDKEPKVFTGGSEEINIHSR